MLEPDPRLSRSVSNGAMLSANFTKIRVGEVHIAVLMVLIHLFPLDQSIAGIVEDQGDKRSFSSQGSLELLTVHHEAAVTADGQDLLIRVDQSGTDGSWDGDAMVAKPLEMMQVFGS